MPRWVLAALVVCTVHLSAQNIPPPKPPEPLPAPAEAPAPEPSRPSADQLKRERPKPMAKNPKEEVPPEEDASLVRENISFNPLEAQKDVGVGNEYFKAGKYRPAQKRYKIATLYDDSNSEAWLRLGAASEKLKDYETVKEAYTKYLAVNPDAKNAAEIRKKLEKLK